MIPLMARVQIRNTRTFRIWIPLFLVWLLLLPLVLLLLPVAFIACWAVRVNPFRATAAMWQILASLRGTDVEVSESPRSSVLIQIP